MKRRKHLSGWGSDRNRKSKRSESGTRNQDVQHNACNSPAGVSVARNTADKVASCFEGDTGFQKGRNRGLEAVLNKATLP